MIERVTHVVDAMNVLNVFCSCYTGISAVSVIKRVTHAVLDVFCSCYAVILAISYVQLLYHVSDLSTSAGHT